MSTKRQTTFAKMDRERAVRERRERKQEKRDAATAARRAKSADARADAVEDPGVAEAPE